MDGLRGDSPNIEPPVESVCELALFDAEINRVACGSLEYCMSLFKRDSNIRKKCLDVYNWAQGYRRGD